MKKRVLSMVLCGMLCMSMVTPQAVYAEEFSDNSVAESVEEAADVELFGDFAEEAFDGTEAAAFSDTAQAAALREERIVLNVSSGMDIAKVANDALGKAKKTTDVHYTVVIPPGNYTLSSSNLYIFSNTTLEAEGAVITKAPNLTKMIKAGTSTYISQNPKTGYDMFTNITINGGVWDNQKAGKTSSVKFGHASNITLKNMEFRGNGAGAHFLEVGGVDGLTVENCKFIGHQPSTKFVAQEAIELECVDGVNFKEYAPNNNLPCKNISITGCTFDDLMGGVGMHNAVLGNYTDNVNVSNNTFKNIGYQGIIMTNARNLTISNNTFTNVLCGIEVEALNNGKAPATPGEAYNPDMNIKISGNTMSLANVLTASQYATLGISLKGTKFTKTTNGIAKGTYKLSNALVQNNTITGSGRGMLVEYADNCQILNNKITFKKLGTWKNYTGYGMVISKSSNNNLIKGCSVTDTKDDNDGIRIIEDSHNNTVESCTVSSGKKYGISERNCNGSKFLKNKVSGREKGGICVSGGNSTQIIGNTLSTSKVYAGILVVDGAKVSKLEKNILIDNKSLALNVGSNKVPSYVKNLKGITVNAIKSTTTTVKGSAPGTTKAYVASGSKILGTAAVGSDGKFSVKIKKQKKNTSLKVYAIDKRSNRVQVTVKVK